jgi:hypothetical protein
MPAGFAVAAEIAAQKTLPQAFGDGALAEVGRAAEQQAMAEAAFVESGCHMRVRALLPW